MTFLQRIPEYRTIEMYPNGENIWFKSSKNMTQSSKNKK